MRSIKWGKGTGEGSSPTRVLTYSEDEGKSHGASMKTSSTGTVTPNAPLVAVALGDPAGIGPELVAKLLSDERVNAAGRPLLIGDEWLWEQGQQVAGISVPTRQISTVDQARSEATHGVPLFLAVDSVLRESVRRGQVGAAGGASVVKVLRVCLDAVAAGHVDAICFAPLNKLAMKKAGLAFEDELHFFADHLGVKSYVCEFNTLGTLWTSRISSHIPFRQIPELITKERIIEAAMLTKRSLVRAGFLTPRIAMAALNPHAGEGGTCGREEIDLMIPAIHELEARGLSVIGPLPADTIFLRARAGEFDAVITMYHDQGQIAIKLMGFDRGVTVHGGLPVAITTPAHGTAFDIVGQNKANPEASVQAFLIAAQMGVHDRMQPGRGQPE
jgi:4-hydroxythreonine-4-phosphate dehydrogenase